MTAARAAGPRLTVYSRAGCHLCDVMLGALASECRDESLSVEVVDVDEDAGLRERFGSRVPVLFLDGREICHYHLDVPALRRALGRP